MDCGSTCLRIIAKFYGKKIDAASLREHCYTTKEGVSLLNISDEAEMLGFRSSGVKITWVNLKENAPFPCIVHWNRHHFVVVYKITKKYVYVSDPGYGLIKYTHKDFLSGWLSTTNKVKQTCGIVLILEPTLVFWQMSENKENKIRLGHFLKYLSPYKSYFAQLALGMLVGSILSLIFPFFSQGIIDFGICRSDLNFVLVMLLAELILVFGQFSNSLIRNWLMLHMTSRISISFISEFLCKLMRLPIAFFDSKKIGDILQRIDDYSRIQYFLTESLLSISMAIVTFVIYGCIMGFYDISILFVFILGSILYLMWIVMFMKKRRKLDFLRFQVASRNQSNIVQLVTGMQDIKLNNCEKQKRWEWEHLQVQSFNISIKSLSLAQLQSIGGILINRTKNIIITFLAAKAVIHGNMTLGMMMAVLYIIGQLDGPISDFISFAQSLQDAKISLERLNEVYDKPDEENIDEDIQDIPVNGDICLKNVSYHYGGPHSRKVLDDVNLLIPGGKVTAIVGPSGSGKTTLLKSLLGFYSPVSGEIDVAGKKMEKFRKSSWRANCGVVMQDGYIFSDSIAKNIGISENHPDMEKVRNAAAVANISQFIEELPLKYNTIIGMEGNGISSGQKQRILIARAVFKNAKYIFFDEATNSLDANNERIILNKLNSFFDGKTVVVAAHRLSTVKHADQIVVLDKGHIIEKGTHEELIKKRGSYFQLVKNQLELGN